MMHFYLNCRIKRYYCLESSWLNRIITRLHIFITTLINDGLNATVSPAKWLPSSSPLCCQLPRRFIDIYPSDEIYHWHRHRIRLIRHWQASCYFSEYFEIMAWLPFLLYGASIYLSIYLIAIKFIHRTRIVTVALHKYSAARRPSNQNHFKYRIIKVASMSYSFISRLHRWHEKHPLAYHIDIFIFHDIPACSHTASPIVNAAHREALALAHFVNRMFICIDIIKSRYITGKHTHFSKYSV